MHTKDHGGPPHDAARAAILALTLLACDKGQAGQVSVDAGGDLQTDAAAGPVLEVSTGSGALRGALQGATRTFLGIPYAKPPLGPRRFMPPEPADPWSGVRPATEMGPACPQPPSALAASPPHSEDCLSLNVYAPAAAGEKRPVLVWIYGGAFISGGSAQYDPTRLSGEGDVVVVTLNYRVGALGFLSLPELDGERPGVPSGNDAVRDQQLALRWVQENIAAFGGNPDDVTLFGESAGAVSTCLHMVSPQSQTLARRYILQSGTCIAGLPLSDRMAAQTRSLALADALCAGATDRLACLRAADAQQIAMWGAQLGIAGAGWAPTIDEGDPLLPAHPLTLLHAGLAKPVELLLGSNRDEWTLFAVAFGPNPKDVAELGAAVDTSLAAYPPAMVAAIKAHYIDEVMPPVTDAEANAVYIRLMTDLTFRCPARTLARSAAALGHKSYLYSFEHATPVHAAELAYLFGVPGFLPTDHLEEVHAMMAGYWLQFAKTGDPNGPIVPTWPPYDGAGDRHMVISTTPAAGSGLSRDDCDFVSALLHGP